MSTLSGVRRAAFVDDSTQTVVRFDRAHEDTEAAVRDLLDSESADTRGDDYFVGYESSVRWREPDLSSVSQLATWMTDRTQVQMVAIGPEKILQWYEPHYIRTSQTTNTNVGDVDPLNAEMRYGGGDGTDQAGDIVGYPNGSHRIYASRNALHPNAYDAADSFIDSDNDEVPDGWSSTNFTSETVNLGRYEAFASASPATLESTVLMPLLDVDWTYSIEFVQLHDDGDNELILEVLDSNGNVVNSDSLTVSTTGRASVSLTASSFVYELRAKVVVRNSTTQNAKVKVTKPALRVDGGTSYVTR